MADLAPLLGTPIVLVVLIGFCASRLLDLSIPQGNKDGYDDTHDDNDDTKNLSSSPDASPSKGYDDSDDNDDKNGLSSSRGTHEQPSLLPHEYLVDPDPPHYYDIEDGNKTW